MDYAYIENDKVIWPVAMRSRFNNIGAWHTLTDERRALEGWYPISYINKEYAPSLQDQRLVSAKLVDNVFEVVYSNRNYSIDEIKEHKKQEIRDEFNSSFSEPVEALNLFWSAGFNSSLSIDGATRISENLGSPTVTLHDDDNNQHDLSIAEGKQVAALIGVDYQLKFAAKQTRMRAVDDVDISAVDAIKMIREI